MPQAAPLDRMTEPWRRMLGAIAVAGVLAASVGCSSDDPSAGPSSAGDTEVVVFAASSLKSTFTAIGSQFEAAHPGTSVVFNFAGSSDLVAQLQQGAPADVLASADTANMELAAADDLVSGAPTSFATNSMMIAVQPDNPGGVATFADLALPGVQVVVCAAQVPCGAATERVEANTGVTLSPVSEESSVADVLNKVAVGESDAGVVYVTDVHGSAGRVVGVEIPEADNAVNTYPIAVLASSTTPSLAEQFTAMVIGAPGQQVLADAGFGVP